LSSNISIPTDRLHRDQVSKNHCSHSKAESHKCINNTN
jgi:hypothetical protein